MKLFTHTKPSDPRAKPLIAQLNKTHLEITGDNGNSSYHAEDFDSSKDTFILLEIDGNPTACGALRFFDDNTCEIKRMYSATKGAGSDLLSALESEALAKGYTNVILSTRKINTKAVNFYLKHHYVKIPGYGKYIKTYKSICLGKKLVQS